LKKLQLFFLFIILFQLTACTIFTPISPDTIFFKGSSLSYSSRKIPNKFFDADIRFVLNKNNEIRCIYIKSKDIVTFKGISVGDSINKAEAAYKYEDKTANTLSVAFNGLHEIDLPTHKSTGNCTRIIYYVNSDGKIEKIQICDNLYLQSQTYK